MNDRLVEIHARYPDIPGAVVAMGAPGQCGYATTGHADVGRSQPIDLNGVFDMGSVHKLFKWILLERLAQAGHLSLEDKINGFVSDPKLTEFTLTDLSRHATGMPDIANEFYGDVFGKFQTGKLPHQYQYDEMVEFLEKTWSGDNAPPFLYSSYGSRIAAEVAEVATKRQFTALMNEFVLEALSLENTSVFSDRHPKNLVQGYGDPNSGDVGVAYGPLPEEVSISVSSGVGGAMYSTATDLLKFTNAIANSSLGFLSKESIERRTAAPTKIGKAIEVGSGVFRYPAFIEGDFWVHGGNGMQSHTAMVAYSKSGNFSVVILVNLNSKFIENGFGFHFDILNAVGALR